MKFLVGKVLEVLSNLPLKSLPRLNSSLLLGGRIKYSTARRGHDISDGTGRTGGNSYTTEEVGVLLRVLAVI